VQVDVEGRRLSLSNLDKVLYPSTGFTKGQVVDYYTRVAPFVLPHLRSRALTLRRYPNGVEASHFFEKQKPSHAPEWVQSTAIQAGGRLIDFVRCEDLPTLVWLANLADLELHPSLALAADPDHPTVLAFDLDPGAPAGLSECCEVALELRETLDGLGLQCFPKTSGGKGMQIYAPLDGTSGYDATKPFANAVARLHEQRTPDRVISSMRKSDRAGKVFIDWSQNDRHKTTVAVYSLRGRDRPTASTPLGWDEVERVADGAPAEDLVFEAPAVLERVAGRGDLFASVLELTQPLPEL
jgi:bifunctional non-homologous end joining protein LigD